MIDVSMLGLVSSDGVDHVEHCALLAELPVRTGNLGSWLGPPGGQIRALGCLLDGADDLGVGVTGLFFNVANEPMAEGRAGNIREEEGGSKTDLTADNRSSENGAGLLELDEGKQMHALIVGLLEKHVEHATIAFHVAERGEVTDDGSYHPWDCSHCFEEDGSIQYLFRGNLTTVPTGSSIKNYPGAFDCAQCYLVEGALGVPVGHLDIELLGGIVPMRLHEHVLGDAVSYAKGVALVLGGSAGGIINGLDEAIDGYGTAGLRGIEKLTELNDLGIGEGRVVLAEQSLDVPIGDSPIAAGVGLEEPRNVYYSVATQRKPTK